MFSCHGGPSATHPMHAFIHHLAFALTPLSLMPAHVCLYIIFPSTINTVIYPFAHLLHTSSHMCTSMLTIVTEQGKWRAAGAGGRQGQAD